MDYCPNMKTSKSKNWCRGLPENVSPQLRRALAIELERIVATYREFVAGSDEPVTPETALKLAGAWNNLTPEQVAAWNAFAEQEKMCGADADWTN
jgi:hypothetical protein